MIHPAFLLAALASASVDSAERAQSIATLRRRLAFLQDGQAVAAAHLPVLAQLEADRDNARRALEEREAARRQAQDARRAARSALRLALDAIIVDGRRVAAPSFAAWQACADALKLAEAERQRAEDSKAWRLEQKRKRAEMRARWEATQAAFAAERAEHRARQAAQAASARKENRQAALERRRKRRGRS